MTTDDLPGISLRQIENIIKGVQRYTVPGLYLPGNNGMLLDVSKWSDYDTYMFFDVFELICFPKNTKPHDVNSQLWTIKISYTRTNGEDYDYVGIARKSNTTEFKYRPSERSVQTKFKLDKEYRVHCPSMIGAKRDAQMAAELSVLEHHLLKLDELTNDISRWAESGLDMLALCKGELCRRHSIIPNRVISDSAVKGLTLNDFKAFLVCKKCGAKNPKILPPLSK